MKSGNNPCSLFYEVLEKSSYDTLLGDFRGVTVMGDFWGNLTSDEIVGLFEALGVRVKVPCFRSTKSGTKEDKMREFLIDVHMGKITPTIFVNSDDEDSGTEEGTDEASQPYRGWVRKAAGHR